ncbi:MAG: hypothetical protein ACLQVI_25325 [Polyangiaceae bacterium]|jgi:hypothetical protein
MARSLLFAFVLAAAVTPACAGEEVGMTTTTSGTVSTGPTTCGRSQSSCARNEDCCGLWCVGGLCERREP